jgi:hypothetical protein
MATLLPDGIMLEAATIGNDGLVGIEAFFCDDALSACDWMRERALNAGCDAFLAKPCLPQVLALEIRRLLPGGAPTSTRTPHAVKGGIARPRPAKSLHKHARDGHVVGSRYEPAS